MLYFFIIIKHFLNTNDAYELSINVGVRLYKLVSILLFVIADANSAPTDVANVTKVLRERVQFLRARIEIVREWHSLRTL